MLSAPNPQKFPSANLETETFDPTKFIRISPKNVNEPFFGHTGANRFDDSTCVYGTSYMGFTLHCAFAETVLHNEVADPVNGFLIPSYELGRRFVITFDGSSVVLAKLCGIPLKRLGGDGSLSTVLPYDVPQAWGQAVYAHPKKVDGILYVSRHLNTEQAVVLFEDRAKSKVHMTSATPFPKYAGSANVLVDFNVTPS
ncbi:RES family NAD+ phosphorylase [Paraburkholderia sp. MM6662-R1]|uniref:RES family NAD+ phosphorylase n=1 Tax=Paraburkholderia sp. MM6662-R1 TaxID=2991066 RepID=UPI003D1E21D2